MSLGIFLLIIIKIVNRMKHIQEELENVDFDINKLRVLLSGGEEAARKAKEMESAIKEEKDA